MDDLTLARFNVKVDRSTGDDGCHLWLGARGPQGYGLFVIRGKQYKAHRVAWEIENGPIPAGLIVRHDCDTPPCCNPKHLRLGTIAQNNQDSKDRNRHRKGARRAVAKITEQDVLAARQMRKGGATYKVIAETLGISYTGAHYAVNGTTWNDLPVPDDMPQRVPREHVPDELVDKALRMRDEDEAEWRDIERVTGYTRTQLMRYLPRRPGRNQQPVLSPDEADDAVRLHRDGASWTKLARHFDNRISRMGLYYACRDGYAWWTAAEARVDGR